MADYCLAVGLRDEHEHQENDDEHAVVEECREEFGRAFEPGHDHFREVEAQVERGLFLQLRGVLPDELGDVLLVVGFVFRDELQQAFLHHFGFEAEIGGERTSVSSPREAVDARVYRYTLSMTSIPIYSCL